MRERTIIHELRHQNASGGRQLRRIELSSGLQWHSHMRTMCKLNTAHSRRGQQAQDPATRLSARDLAGRQNLEEVVEAAAHLRRRHLAQVQRHALIRQAHLQCAHMHPACPLTQAIFSHASCPIHWAALRLHGLASISGKPCMVWGPAAHPKAEHDAADNQHDKVHRASLQRRANDEQDAADHHCPPPPQRSARMVDQLTSPSQLAHSLHALLV